MGAIGDTGFSYKVKEGEVLFSLYYNKGGELPDCLKGQWSDLRVMTNAVMAYIGRDKEIISEEEAEKRQKRKNLLAAKKRESKLKKAS